MGERLLELRKRSGLSQEELAARLSVSRQTISRWEMGTSKPDTDNILQLCQAFGVSADYLLSGGPAPAQEQAGGREDERGQGRAWRIGGVICGLVGALGHLAVWLASTMVLLQVPNAAEPAWLPPMDSSDTWVREYGVFVEHYHLQAVLGVLWMLLIAGIALFAWGMWRRKRRQTLHP